MTILADGPVPAAENGGKPMTDTTMPRLEVRTPAPGVSVIEIAGEVTARVRSRALRTPTSAPRRPGATPSCSTSSGLEYMNSSGIGLLVTLLVRAQRNRQRILAYGLTEHYRQIFELTRLDEVISIHETEARGARRGRLTSQKGSHMSTATREPGCRRMGAAGRPAEARSRTGGQHQRHRTPADGADPRLRPHVAEDLPRPRWAGRDVTPAEVIDGLEGSTSPSSGRTATASSRRSPGSRPARSPRSTCRCRAGSSSRPACSCSTPTTSRSR